MGHAWEPITYPDHVSLMSPVVLQLLTYLPAAAPFGHFHVAPDEVSITVSQSGTFFKQRQNQDAYACHTIRKVSRRLGGQSSSARETCAQTCITIDSCYIHLTRMLHELNVQIRKQKLHLTVSGVPSLGLCSSYHTSSSRFPLNWIIKSMISVCKQQRKAWSWHDLSLVLIETWWYPRCKSFRVLVFVSKRSRHQLAASSCPEGNGWCDFIEENKPEHEIHWTKVYECF